MYECYYTSFAGMAFGWTQTFPAFVTLTLSIFGAVTSEIAFLIFGLYLHFAQYELWPFQSYFKSVRPNPICQLYHSYAFPNVESFYVAAIISAFVTYGYLWDKAYGVIAWLILDILAALPLVLIFFSYSRWWELFVSMALGVFFSTVFVIVLKSYICPLLPYLLNTTPCTWLGYTDTYLMNKIQRIEFEKCRNATNAVRLSSSLG
jgi:hypothetical protein